ncbi:unnamed protein product [Pleuronectes platessa]|uniref:Uncharacterized protein n=1 Tax=Pleuronectes platessa TaxID=8262 RepID=A0A9N7YJ22_PLEPL|nr:unnamed protein product [Pleuronectes platessa]
MLPSPPQPPTPNGPHPQPVFLSTEETRVAHLLSIAVEQWKEGRGDGVVPMNVSGIYAGNCLVRTWATRPPASGCESSTRGILAGGEGGSESTSRPINSPWNKQAAAEPPEGETQTQKD